MATMGDVIHLCEECLQRANYAEFLMSRPDNTIQEVSEYVDAPECKKTPICRWKEKWIRSTQCKVGGKSLLRFSSPGPEGREENKILPSGWNIKDPFKEVQERDSDGS